MFKATSLKFLNKNVQKQNNLVEKGDFFYLFKDTKYYVQLFSMQKCPVLIVLKKVSVHRAVIFTVRFTYPKFN